MPTRTTGSETSNNRGSDVDYVWVDVGSFLLTPDGMTVAEALRLLYAAATRDPYHGDIAQLLESRRVLESALGLEE